MFTKIILKNFASFGSATLCLAEGKNKYKNFSLIYGENGSGKTNLCYSILLLIDLLSTMDFNDFINIIRDKAMQKDDPRSMPKEVIENLLREASKGGMSNIIKNVRMTNCSEDTVVSYEFTIDGKRGIYTLSFNDQQLKQETLYFVLNERQVLYFDITPGDYSKINKHIFTREDFYQDVLDNLNKYWGKHSFFSILLHEEFDKSKSFTNGSISSGLKQLTDKMIRISGRINDEKTQSPFRSESTIKTEDFIDYQVPNTPELDQIMENREKAYNLFFTSENPTYQSVFFRKKVLDQNEANFHLWCNRLINGKVRTIDFSNESLGNRYLIPLISSLSSAINGDIVVIDEIDCGIHDKLLQYILCEVKPLLKGQLIMTTHNTTLMSCPEFRKDLYIISEDRYGIKQIRNVFDYKERTFVNNNIQKKYFAGDYGGLPIKNYYSFSNLASLLDK